MNTPPPIAVPPRRILVVFNPAAGRARRARFEHVMTALRAHSCVVTLKETTAPRHAESIARDSSAMDFDIIAAAGGDGTINEVVNGLVGKNMPVGLIPLGTANVLAREIGLRLTPKEIAHALAYGPIKPIRVGRANERRFTMMAGVGFDANVVANVSLPLKKRFGPFAYVWQGVAQAATDSFPNCDVIIDGATHRAASVLVCKGSRYGGPFVAAPGVALGGDQFHVVLMQGRGWMSVLRYGVALVLGKLSTLRDVTLVVGREITVDGEAGQPVQADGDILARLPVHITIDPEPVRVVHPA